MLSTCGGMVKHKQLKACHQHLAQTCFTAQTPSLAGLASPPSVGDVTNWRRKHEQGIDVADSQHRTGLQGNVESKYQAVPGARRRRILQSWGVGGGGRAGRARFFPSQSQWWQRMRLDVGLGVSERDLGLKASAANLRQVTPKCFGSQDHGLVKVAVGAIYVEGERELGRAGRDVDSPVQHGSRGKNIAPNHMVYQQATLSTLSGAHKTRCKPASPLPQSTTTPPPTPLPRLRVSPSPSPSPPLPLPPPPPPRPRHTHSLQGPHTSGWPQGSP
jgi:hypothetical protein